MSHMNGGREKERVGHRHREMEEQQSSHIESLLDHPADNVKLIMEQGHIKSQPFEILTQNVMFS